MSLFFDFHPDRYPPGSFQTPVQPPEPAPEAEPLVTLCINQAWIPFILGALAQLTMNTTWSGTDAEIQAARQQANNLILIFQQAMLGCPARSAGSGGPGDDFMLRQDPDNPCLLQTSVDGVNWCTWADLTKCTPNSQPAQGTKPTPGDGGCSQYTGECSIGHSWSLPNQVNSGDQITVTNANGLWASPLDLFLSRCPDGNLWFELACVEGTGHTEPGDPAPTINHDSLVAFDGTNYYDCGSASDGVPAVFTILPGISNAPLVFMANTPDSSGTGNVVFDVQYCNNAPGSWTHTFNFLTSNGGWVPQAIGSGGEIAGVWTPGTGWVGTDFPRAGENRRQIEIIKTISATEINAESMAYNLTVGTIDSPTGFTILDIVLNATTVVGTDEAGTTQGTNVRIGFFTDVTGVTTLQVDLISDRTTGSQTGVCQITSLTFSGVGVDPFGGP